MSACTGDHQITNRTARNETNDPYLIRLVDDVGSDAAARHYRVFDLPPRTTITLPPEGFASKYAVRALEILSPDCAILDHLAHPGGGTVVIRPGPQVEFSSGAPTVGSEAPEVPACPAPESSPSP